MKTRTAVHNGSNLEQLHARLTELADEAKAITASTEGREMTHSEKAEMDGIVAEFNQIETRINAASLEDRHDEMSRPMPRRSQPNDLHPSASATARPAMSITGGVPSSTRAPKAESWGWSGPGEFTKAVFNASRGAPSPRLLNAASSYGSEGLNEDGGFAVPPDFRQNILSLVQGDDSLMALCDVQRTNSNSLSLPIDSVSPHDTSAGVVVNWEGEGATLTQSKPKLGAIDTKLHKLAALVPLTDELMEDAPAVGNWLPGKVGTKFNHKLNDAIVNGNGIGKPMGLLSAPCKITVAAQSGQGAGTVVFKNIIKMWARLPTGSRSSAVWLCHPDVEQQLQQLVMTGTNPNAGIFLPGGSLINAGAATLLGRPLVVSEACQALGTEGDIILTDLKQYLVATKVSGVRADVSMHVWFDQNITAFRFTMRVGGQSYWPAAMARQNGSSTASPIITLNSTRT